MSVEKCFIQYSNPHLSIVSIINFFLGKNSKYKLIDYFSSYTGKEYILPTFSCRSALYLAYRAIEINGEVITSPLTCLTAILPIIHSANKPIYTDINKEDLNIDPLKIEQKISSDTVAIQLIHLAGYPCDIDPIIKLAEKKKILIVEDCAQAFGAKYKNINIGSFGDIACFSLAKNLYGIVGGILATNNKLVYDKAKQIQESFEQASLSFLFYRMLRNFLRSKPNNKAFIYFHNLLINFKNKTKETNRTNSADEEIKSLTSYLKKPKDGIFNLAWSQIQYLNMLHAKRKKIAGIYLKKINMIDNIKTPQNREDIERSFAKFYIWGDFNSKVDIEKLNEREIEAKHLEEEYKVYYQTRFDQNPLLKNNPSINDCKNYFDIHDSLISLPLTEELTVNEIDKVLNTLKEIMDSK